MLCGFLSPWYDTSSVCEWTRRPLDMEGSCEYIEKAVADSRQRSSSSLRVGREAYNSSRQIKRLGLLQNVTQGLGLDGYFGTT